MCNYVCNHANSYIFKQVLSKFQGGSFHRWLADHRNFKNYLPQTFVHIQYLAVGPDCNILKYGTFIPPGFCRLKKRCLLLNTTFKEAI